MNKKAMYKLSYGLFVLTAKDAEKDNGCIINTAVQAASEPNQLSICVNKANYTHDMIQKTGKFTVSVLSQEAQFGLFEQFGFQSGRNVNKFEAFEKCARGLNGIYYITEGTNAYISVTVKKTEDLGSHTMFIGEITDMVRTRCSCFRQSKTRLLSKAATHLRTIIIRIISSRNRRQ